MIIPVFNEAGGLDHFHKNLVVQLSLIKDMTPEIIYCNDGSTDNSVDVIKRMSQNNHSIKLVSLSRNFGKEIAVTAGIHNATGDALLMIDADGQHPVELISKFIQKWRSGSKVVVGIRTANRGEGGVKKYGSKLFYYFINKVLKIQLTPNATDFRLIDKVVQQDFIAMTERNRISRGMIDWLGYKQDFIKFKAHSRFAGQASYSFKKLFKLGIDTIISLSTSPLYLASYIGVVTLFISTLLGIFMVLDAILKDPFGLNITGSAYLTVFLLFLMGILFIFQGIIGLYLSHIHAETQGRPLFIIDRSNSTGLNEK